MRMRSLASILLIGIVKKNGIMMINFALEAERNHGKKPDEESGHCNTNWNRMDAD